MTADRPREVVLRAPVAGDVPALVEMFAADIASLGRPVDEARLVGVAQALVSEDERRCRVRVATIGGAPPGAVIVAHRWISVEFSGEAMWIETLFVADHHRRRGLGRLMVEELIGYAKEHGVSGIDLEAYRMNAPASFLYRSLGFRRLGRERYSLRISKD